MPTAYSTILDKLQKASIKVLSSEGYTILDDDHYTEIWVTTGASDRTIALPTLADNLSRKIKIKKMDSGVGKVVVEGEGSETINGTLNVSITEQYGWWEFTAGASEWSGDTDGQSTILYVGSTTYDDLNTANNTWDDVAGMSLSLTPGKWLLETEALHYVQYASGATAINNYFGLGVTSGNNVPTIWSTGIGYKLDLTGSYAKAVVNHRFKSNILYSTASNVTIYMKAKHTIGASANYHQMYPLGTTQEFPMYIKARRTA